MELISRPIPRWIGETAGAQSADPPLHDPRGSREVLDYACNGPIFECPIAGCDRAEDAITIYGDYGLSEGGTSPGDRSFDCRLCAT
jgi:hypothetical protein